MKIVRSVLFLFSAICVWPVSPANAEAKLIGNCYLGAYRFADGSVVDIARSEGDTLRWRKFDGTETVFEGRDGIKLAGRLVLPKSKTPVPVVVLVHGAEDMSARESYALQRLLPAEGVGAFVYDKRGTGGSEGKYTQDFDTLADDVVAAM